MGAAKQETLSSAIFGKTRRAVLALFFSHPEQAFYLRQITRIAGVGQGAVQRELKRLSESGIIAKSMRGKQTYYQANQDCPIYSELLGLMAKTAGLAEVLREALLPLKERIEFAFIYGSQASGSISAQSDVDLMVMGDVDEMALHRTITEAEKQISRPVNYTLLDREEFSRRRKEKGGFLSRVLKGEKILLLGQIKNV